MRIGERHLRHGADPEKFGSAMSKCEGFAPDCSYHGRCMADGACFASPPHLVAARMIEDILPPMVALVCISLTFAGSLRCYGTI